MSQEQDNQRPSLRERVRALRGGEEEPSGGGGSLDARVTALEEAVEENRRLNQRLADVVDVITEVLVPAVDRDDERLKAALKRLNDTLG
jgi:hypothetical protein